MSTSKWNGTLDDVADVFASAGWMVTRTVERTFSPPAVIGELPNGLLAIARRLKCGDWIFEGVDCSGPGGYDKKDWHVRYRSLAELLDELPQVQSLRQFLQRN